MLAKVLTCAVEASFHRRDTSGKGFSDFGVTPALLDQGEQRTILWPQLGERVPKGIELFRINCSRRFGNVFVFLAKWEENAPQFLAPQLIDTRVAREPKQPGLELGWCFQTIYRADHLDKNLLSEVFDVITAAGHGVNESRDSVLVCDHELSLGTLVALLSSADQFHQRIR
jgi:hypothetical protein